MRRQLIKLWLFYCYIVGKVLSWAPGGKIKKGEHGGMSFLTLGRGIRLVAGVQGAFGFDLSEP